MPPMEEIGVRNREAQDAVDRASTYEWGFTSDIEQEFAPKGLNEDIVRFISEKKGEPEWLLQWRLDAFRRWVSIFRRLNCSKPWLQPIAIWRNSRAVQPAFPIRPS